MKDWTSPVETRLPYTSIQVDEKGKKILKARELGIDKRYTFRDI